MATRRDSTVVDPDGVRARIREFIVDDSRASAVIVELAGGARITLPTELLHHHADGGYAIEAPWKSLAGAGSLELEVPVIAEIVTVGVRSVPRERLHVRRRVVTEQQIVETPIWTERIQVDHVPIGTFVERAPAARQEGDTLIIPCVEEVAVVEKRLRVREELRIRVVREQRIDRQSVPVRRFEIEIEREHNPTNPTNPRNSKRAGGGS
ncbi:MAG: YsnF/AvaK domain-containing protein [Deltaproteobacteria bacterium]|nr:YsnF/AvaK domain-containing protein [Deltaproteobacteria bacterium]